MSMPFSSDAKFSSGSLFRNFRQVIENLIIFRETAHRFLGKEEASIGLYLEDAASRLDEFDIGKSLRFQKIGQTGRFGIVVSFNAVFNGDMHGEPPVYDFRNGML